jgi:hypothetical protein
MRRVWIGFALLLASLLGCGEPTEPPLTQDQLKPEQKVTPGNEPPPGNVPPPPAANPNAPYQPRR